LRRFYASTTGSGGGLISIGIVSAVDQHWDQFVVLLRDDRRQAVGDRVKEGQLVGTIESLNVFNEVESPVAGRVVEIFVQEGQPVEYGQLLMTVASFTEE